MIDINSLSAELKLGDNEIWYSQDNESISYPSDGNETCFLIEDHSFWFKHRNNCIVSVVKSYPPEDNGAIFVDLHIFPLQNFPIKLLLNR